MFVHAQSPVRIGIAGGGSDLPAWTAKRKGLCLGLAIARYTHACAITRPDRRVVAAYRQRDEAGAATEIANGLIRESALLHGWEDGFEIHTMSELSSHGSGLGVSSSIAVSLAAAFALMARLAKAAPDWNASGGGGASLAPVWAAAPAHESPPGRQRRSTISIGGEFSDGGLASMQMQAAKDAWTVEIDRLRRPIGRQDHMAAAHGGLRLYAFEGAEACVEAEFSRADAEWAATHLALIPLPAGHDSRAILAGAQDPAPLEIAFNAVERAAAAIARRDPALLGAALNAGQQSKEAIPGACPLALRRLVGEIAAGCYGAKVAGAGGGGHIVLARDPELEAISAAGEMIPLEPIAPDFGGCRCEGIA